MDQERGDVFHPSVEEILPAPLAIGDGITASSVVTSSQRSTYFTAGNATPQSDLGNKSMTFRLAGNSFAALETASLQFGVLFSNNNWVPSDIFGVSCIDRVTVTVAGVEVSSETGVGMARKGLLYHQVSPAYANSAMGAAEGHYRYASVDSIYVTAAAGAAPGIQATDTTPDARQVLGAIRGSGAVQYTNKSMHGDLSDPAQAKYYSVGLHYIAGLFTHDKLFPLFAAPVEITITLAGIRDCCTFAGTGGGIAGDTVVTLPNLAGAIDANSYYRLLEPVVRMDTKTLDPMYTRAISSLINESETGLLLAFDHLSVISANPILPVAGSEHVILISKSASNVKAVYTLFQSQTQLATPTSSKDDYIGGGIVGSATLYAGSTQVPSTPLNNTAAMCDSLYGAFNGAGNQFAGGLASGYAYRCEDRQGVSVGVRTVNYTTQSELTRQHSAFALGWSLERLPGVSATHLAGFSTKSSGFQLQARVQFKAPNALTGDVRNDNRALRVISVVNSTVGIELRKGSLRVIR